MQGIDKRQILAYNYVVWRVLKGGHQQRARLSGPGIRYAEKASPALVDPLARGLLKNGQKDGESGRARRE